MAKVTIGSARHDENGKLNGIAGDQLQSGSGNDFKGEVSMQDFYVHKYGWYVIRFKDIGNRHKCAERMVKAANNEKIGYSQKERLKILTDGIEAKKNTNCDCSSLLREVFKEASGCDPGNFSTENGKDILEATGLVNIFSYAAGFNLQTGDILMSKKKSHCAVVVLGTTPTDDIYYPAYKGKSNSLASALESVGEKDSSFSHRKKIAIVNGVSDYVGSIKQNLFLVDLLKQGKLLKA